MRCVIKQQREFLSSDSLALWSMIENLPLMIGPLVEGGQDKSLKTFSLLLGQRTE